MNRTSNGSSSEEVEAEAEAETKGETVTGTTSFGSLEKNLIQTRRQYGNHGKPFIVPVLWNHLLFLFHDPADSKK